MSCFTGSYICASEGEDCDCIGIVKYGKDSTWTSERWNDKGTIACTNDVFDDPLPNIRKECKCIPEAIGML